MGWPRNFFDILDNMFYILSSLLKLKMTYHKLFQNTWVWANYILINSLNCVLSVYLMITLSDLESDYINSRNIHIHILTLTNRAG